MQGISLSVFRVFFSRSFFFACSLVPDVDYVLDLAVNACGSVSVFVSLYDVWV